MSMDEETRARLAADLIESDAAYFEADAVIEALPGATLAHMPELPSLAAACVVHRVDTAALERDPAAFIGRVEAALVGLGRRQSRIYLYDKSPAADRWMLANGYRPGVELASVLVSAPAKRRPDVLLRPVNSEDGWGEKRRIHEAMTTAPDGHAVDPGAWTDMERRKCDAGYMSAYLAVHDGQVVGAVNAAPCASVLRLKNLFVHPDCRRRGVAAQVIRQFGALAFEMGKAATGAFVLADAPFAGMYTRAGYELVGQQTEWCKELDTK